MNYERAKKLKDAGYDQRQNGGRTECIIGKTCVYYPTLSELIEACGDVAVLLWSCKEHRYYASSQLCNQALSDTKGITARVEGATPEEAVANLWLKLHEKNKPTKAEIRRARQIVNIAAGHAIAKKRGKKGMSKIGKKGAAVRWKKA